MKLKEFMSRLFDENRFAEIGERIDNLREIYFDLGYVDDKSIEKIENVPDTVEHNMKHIFWNFKNEYEKELSDYKNRFVPSQSLEKMLNIFEKNYRIIRLEPEFLDKIERIVLDTQQKTGVENLADSDIMNKICSYIEPSEKAKELLPEQSVSNPGIIKHLSKELDGIHESRRYSTRIGGISSVKDMDSFMKFTATTIGNLVEEVGNVLHSALDGLATSYENQTYEMRKSIGLVGGIDASAKELDDRQQAMKDDIRNSNRKEAGLGGFLASAINTMGNTVASGVASLAGTEERKPKYDIFTELSRLKKVMLGEPVNFSKNKYYSSITENMNETKAKDVASYLDQNLSADKDQYALDAKDRLYSMRIDKDSISFIFQEKPKSNDEQKAFDVYKSKLEKAKSFAKKCLSLFGITIGQGGQGDDAPPPPTMIITPDTKVFDCPTVVKELLKEIGQGNYENKEIIVKVIEKSLDNTGQILNKELLKEKDLVQKVLTTITPPQVLPVIETPKPEQKPEKKPAIEPGFDYPTL